MTYIERGEKLTGECVLTVGLSRTRPEALPHC